MPRRPTRACPTVILPGEKGAGPEHWQTWLAAQLHAAGRVVRHPQLPEADGLSLAGWLSGLRGCLDGLPDDGFDVVAHSLGAVLWLHHAAAGHPGPRPARVALVAPPSPGTAAPELAEFFPPPLDVDAVRGAAEGTVLVGGDDDPYAPEGIAAGYGRPLKMPTTVVAGGGHLDTVSGYGAWPAMLDWCRRDNLAFIA